MMSDDMRPTFLAAEFAEPEVLNADDAVDAHDDDLADEPEVAMNAEHAIAVVEVLAKALSESPDQIAVRQGYDRARGAVSLSIECAADDTGRLIGRRGRVIQAVRQLARAAGSKDGTRVMVDVAE